MGFKDRLKQLRVESNMTQAELGKLLSYVSSTVSNYESGKNEPSIKDLKKIANVFKTSLDNLVGTDDNSNNNQVKSAKVKKLIEGYNCLSDISGAYILDYCQFLITLEAKEKAKHKDLMLG